MVSSTSLRSADESLVQGLLRSTFAHRFYVVVFFLSKKKSNPILIYQGYVDRQALYACATCAPHPAAAGVCLACSYACHDGHELYELYTKRDFRCDCGNSKFPNMTCSLYSVCTRLKHRQTFRVEIHALCTRVSVASTVRWIYFLIVGCLIKHVKYV